MNNYIKDGTARIASMVGLCLFGLGLCLTLAGCFWVGPGGHGGGWGWGDGHGAGDYGRRGGESRGGR